MGLAWTHALRFAPGTALRFSLKLQPALHTALVQALPAAKPWLERIEGAVLTVVVLEREHCEVHASPGADATRLGNFTAAPNPDGAYRVQVEWAAASGPQVRDFDGIALMLGGERDVYIALRTQAESLQLSRWHYERDGSVIVSIYPATFASRLSAVVRALLPAELRIGTLQPIIKPAGA